MNRLLSSTASFAMLGFLLAQSAGAATLDLVLSGGPSPLDRISVDDDLHIHLDGSPLLIDDDGFDNSQYGRYVTLGPVSFTATGGVHLFHIIATDTQGGCRDLSPLYLHGASFVMPLETTGFPRECETSSGEVFYDKAISVTLPGEQIPEPRMLVLITTGAFMLVLRRR